MGIDNTYTQKRARKNEKEGGVKGGWASAKKNKKNQTKKQMKINI